MRFFKPVLVAVTAAVSLSLLTGCGTQNTQPNYVAVPKTARYGTGLNLNKTVTALISERQNAATAITHAVGTSKNAAEANAFIYDNVKSASYDLGANSPYFVNKTRTTTKCSLGKAQGTDIGEGYYVVGDTFITPATGYTLTAADVNTKLTTVVKELIKEKLVTSSYTTSMKAAGKYELTLKDGSSLRIKTTLTGSDVKVIRITNVLQPTTCYNLNGLPYTSPQAVASWVHANKVSGSF